jgi:hypothetical protein
MVKKLFALASVTALTGLIGTAAVAGCSSTTVSDTTNEAGGGGVDASGKDAAPKPKADAGDDTDAAVSNTCPSKDPIDATQLPWKSPTKLIGSCADKDLTDLVKYVEMNSMAQYADWKKSVANAACSSCIFGKETDATWKPLLENAKGQLVGLNVGGCIAIASGSDKCGQSYQNWFDCRFQACADCPNGDTAALQKCLSAASKSACKPAFDAVTKVCTDTVIADAEGQCQGAKFVFEGPIKAQCIGLKEGGE